MKLKGDETLGNDPKLPLGTGYYLQTVGTITSVYIKPFLPEALAASSPVFQAQLEKKLPKAFAMATMREIRDMEDGLDPFALEDEKFEFSLNFTTAQQNIVENLIVRGTPISARRCESR